MNDLVKKSMRLVLPIAGFWVFAAGCAYTSQLAPDTIEKANAGIALNEQSKTPLMNDEDKARLSHIFSDRPEYSALVMRDDRSAKLPRLRSSAVPKYPFGLWVTDAKATIKVAFVVSEAGVVEDARIYEASDDRFSANALEAVREWIFYPGSLAGVPVKFVFVVPIVFDGRKK